MIYGNSGIGKTRCSKEFAEINKLNFIKLDECGIGAYYDGKIYEWCFILDNNTN